DEGRLSRTADPGYGDERAERDLDVDVLEVVGAGAANDEPLAVALAAVCWDRDLSVASQERRGYRVRVLQHLLDGACGDDLAAMFAGGGADVDHVVGGPDRLLVVLHHDQGVAEVPQ